MEGEIGIAGFGRRGAPAGERPHQDQDAEGGHPRQKGKLHGSEFPC